MNETEENLNELLKQKDVVAITFVKVDLNEYRYGEPPLPAWRIKIESEDPKRTRSVDVTCKSGGLGLAVALKALRDAGSESS